MTDNKYNPSNYKGLNARIGTLATDGTKYRPMVAKIGGRLLGIESTLVKVNPKAFKGVKRRQRLKMKRRQA